VLTCELLIDHGDFTMQTINDLMLLYSQAIEYYNGINDEKYTYFESRIQNLLIRPEVYQVMADASRDPTKFDKDQEAKKKALEDKSEKQLRQERLLANEARKKERIQKLKASTEIAEELKITLDPVYKQTAEHIEQQAEFEREAKEVLKKNIAY